MMFLRSRRTMTAVAAAASLVLTATAVPQSPFSPVAAQAATANKTQDTSLPLKCTLFAAGGPKNKIPFIGSGFMENRDFTGNFHVTMPGQVEVGEVFEASVSMDSLSASHSLLRRLGGSPSFEEGSAANKVRFAVKGDVELVNSNLPATLDKGKGVLTVDKMMQPSKSGDTVTIAFAPLKLKFKAKKAGLVEIQTPEAYRTPDSHGGVRNNNMFHGEGIAGTVLGKTPGLRVTCLTDRFTQLGATQVGKDAEFNEPKYSAIEVKQQDTATSKNTAQAPEGTTYAKGANAPEWATVGQDGTVTVKPSLDVKPGDYTVPVVVTYPDSSTDNAVVNVTVKEKGKSLAEQHDPQFGETTVEQEGAATIAAPEGLPEGTKVAAGEGVPEWVTVKEDGSIETKPTRETEPKDYTIPVTVTYPDGTTDKAELKVTVTERAINEIHDPTYSDVTVKQGDEVTAPAPTDVAEGATFEAGEGVPSWITVNPDGTVTAKPGLEVEAKEYTVPVKVSYKDGSSDDTTVNITVTVKPANEIHDPSFEDVSVKPGETVTSKVSGDTGEGAKFTAGEGAPEWATVKPDGTVTLKPGKDVEPGEYTVPVEITYSDGASSTVELKVNVEKQDKPSGSSGSSNGSSSSSGVAGSSPLGKFFAALFGTIAIGAGLFGLYNWARAHGYVR